MNKEFYIAGVQFRPEKGIIEGMEKDDILDLTPEPTNQYDSNAIKVEYVDDEVVTHLGYVPAKFCAEVGAALTINPSLPCTILEYNPESKPWERILVQVGEPLPKEVA